VTTDKSVVMTTIMRFKLRTALMIVACFAALFGAIAAATNGYCKRLRITAELTAMGACWVAFDDNNDPEWVAFNDRITSSDIARYTTLRYLDFTDSAALHQEVCCLSKSVVNTLVLSKRAPVHFCRPHRVRQLGKRMLGKGMVFCAKEDLASSNRQFGSNFRLPDSVPIRLPAIRLPSTCSPVSHPPATETMLPRTLWNGITGELTTA
jgi:hypothetical protein